MIADPIGCSILSGPFHLFPGWVDADTPRSRFLPSQKGGKLTEMKIHPTTISVKEMRWQTEVTYAMQVFGTSKTKSHIKCISDNMYKQLPDKTDGDNGTAV